MKKQSLKPPSNDTPKASKDLFERIMSASGVAMAIRNAELQPLIVNQAFLDYYGYDMSEIKAFEAEEILPKVTLAMYKEEVLPALRRGNSWEGEYAIRTKTGQARCLWSRFDPIFNEDGDLEHVISINHSTPDSCVLRNTLETCNASLNFISEATSDIFFRMNLLDGTYDYLSSSVERFSGYSLEEYEKNPLLIRDLIHPDWREYFAETFEELRQGIVRPEYEFQFVHKSGKVHWANQRVILHRDALGVPVAIEGIATDITARKEAEEALRASEEKFRFLTENISDVIWTMDDDLRVTYATPSIKDVWGYSMEEARQCSLLDIIRPSSIPLILKAQEERRVAEEEGNFDYISRLELEYQRGDGSFAWMENVVRRTYDSDGFPVGYQGLSRDITESKMTGAVLAERESRYRTLFEDSPISLWEEDLSRLKQYFDQLREEGVRDFRRFFYDNPEALAYCATLVEVVDVNRATLELFHARTKEELFGNLEKVLTESSMAAFTEEMILLASGGCEYCGEITNLTLHGETIWVMVHFYVPDEYMDCLSRVIVSMLDVTPRKRAEQALIDSEERYRVLAENSQEGVVVTQDGEIIYINESMSEILGYSMDELKKIHPLELAHPADKVMALNQMSDYASGREKTAFATFRIIAKAGEVRWLTFNVKPITWGGREARLEILTDITHHKVLESELLMAHAEMEDRVRKRTQELSEANVQLKAEAEERAKAREHILSLTQQIIRVQEDERQRIARDLHDNVAQDLSSVMLQLETLFDGVTPVHPELERRAEDITQVLKKAISSVRDIAYGLRPTALDQLGLVLAIKNLCQEAGGKHGFEVDFFSAGLDDLPLDFDAEINIYRMVQEAVRNVSLHAKASLVAMRLVKSHPDILIRLEDNGQGFDMETRVSESFEEKRMGLRSMEERARLIGGSMTIQSRTGLGTRILFKIPIENARRHD